jgi:hypothetical protein
MAPRNVCITAADGQTGFLIAELLLTDDTFKSEVDSVTALTLHPSSAHAKELHKLGAKVVPHKPGREKEVTQLLKETGCDTICLIPPAHEDKFDITMEMIQAAKKSQTVQNVLFISTAGADLAEREKQPRLREFVDLETAVMSAKGDTSTPLGHSPCILRCVQVAAELVSVCRGARAFADAGSIYPNAYRAGFYAENLLLYAPNAQKDGVLPLPIGKDHKFAPVSLGVSSFILTRVLALSNTITC